MGKWENYLIVLGVFLLFSFSSFVGDKDASGNSYTYSSIEAINCMAQNIYFEARAESTAGKIAVGQVVLNRSKDKGFPTGVCDVIKQGSHFSNGVPKRDLCQFSWYCVGKTDYPSDKGAWRESLRLADYLLSGRVELLDITDGAKYYHAEYVQPRWASRKYKTAKIDRHIFYR